ncbi:peptidoglycan-binding protein [Streptomyces sp. AHU1]|uniref:peptidoglycan-binding domain-containing protein n=1 Tax=Streptomyces sp. AHU1 TaxID=3377215 RepID=UPI003877D423
MTVKHRGRRVGAAAAVAAFAVFGLQGVAQANPDAPNVGYGYRNHPSAVVCVQKFYNHYLAGPALIATDGKFGRETYAATRRLQQWVNQTYKGQYSLDVDGVVGKRTGDALIGIARKDQWIDPVFVNNCAAALPTTR